MSDFEYRQLVDALLYLRATVYANCQHPNGAINHLQNLDDFVHKVRRESLSEVDVDFSEVAE